MLADAFYLDRPLVIAHRGARDVAPENTLAAFQAALDAGADGIELDVSRCATGEIMVLHDDTVERTTDGHGRLEALSFAALRALDAGAWFGAHFTRERLPLLSEALDLARGRLRVNIEIKVRGGGDDQIEVEIAELVRARGMQASVIISSFGQEQLARMRRAAPELACGFLYQRPAPDAAALLALARDTLDAQAVHPHLAGVDADYVELAHALGLRVNVWTVNEEADLRHLIALGVDGLITDHPALARGLLG